MTIDFNAPPKPRGDVSKLPKWAQDYIEIMARRVRDCEREMDMIAGAATEEPGSVSFTDHMRAARPIPVSHRVLFYYEPYGRMPSYIGARYLDDKFNGDGVEIGASRRILIEPRATNNVHIRLEEK